MSTQTLLLIVLALAVFGGGGFYGFRTWGPYGGGGISIGGVIVLLIVLRFFGLI